MSRGQGNVFLQGWQTQSEIRTYKEVSFVPCETPLIPTFVCLNRVADSTSNDAIMLHVSPTKIGLAALRQWLRQGRLLGMQHGPIALCVMSVISPARKSEDAPRKMEKSVSIVRARGADFGGVQPRTRLRDCRRRLMARSGAKNDQNGKILGATSLSTAAP